MGIITSRARAVLEKMLAPQLLPRIVPSPPIAPLVCWRPHKSLVHGIACMPDGDTIVTAGEDTQLLVLSIRSGEVLHRLEGHHGPVNSLTLTPSKQRLITGGDDTTVRVWDTLTWRLLYTLEGHSEYVRSVAATDTIAVSGGEDERLCVWDIERGMLLHEKMEHPENVMTVAISPDGHFAASASLDNALRLWNLHTGQLERVFYNAEAMVTWVRGGLYLASNRNNVPHKNTPRGLCFTSDSLSLLSADREVLLWNIFTGEKREIVPLSEQITQALCLHPIAKTLALAFYSNSLQIWNSGTSKRLAVLDVGGEEHTAIAFIDDSSKLLSGTRSGEVFLWALPSSETFNEGNHPSPVRQTIITIRSDGTPIAASADNKGGIRLWDFLKNKLVASIDSHPTDWECHIAFSRDGTTLVSSTDEGKLNIWDTTTGQLVRTISPNFDRPRSISSLQMLDEQHAVVGSGDHLILYDISGESLPVVFEGRTGLVSDIQVSTNHQLAFNLAYFNPDPNDDSWDNNVNQLQCWDLHQHRLLWTQTAKKLGDRSLHFGFIAVAPDGNKLVTLSHKVKRKIAIWDAKTGLQQGSLDIPGDWVMSAQFVDDRVMVLVSGSKKGTFLCRINIETKQVLDTAQFHLKDLRSVSIAEDGQTVLVASERSLQSINTASKTVEDTYNGYAIFYQCALSCDGRYAIAGDSSGGVHLLARA
ncbi:MULTISPECIES: WD40 repeat domain-containing protein [Nostocales]|uniref:WD40 repeat domain-containing protein n=3 Tax=Nostocales TaxID=1161 RepID=A0A0C1N498_9CYAN|nr:WD40 repeat domain-containing protein [Tolypothrix bouteillei]KAF3889285.1 WD40 repeat domain-containing protein [Tolypothrix bouteillei VB521301]